ncbi:MAG: 50S ribosomal protein L24e [Thaumarchaeota archaeon]|nr:50S ribosomal protein L24e [Nitrososphaerota archaeon]
MSLQKTCSFCRGETKTGTGLTLVLNDGSVHLYCSSKCRKSDSKLKRDPRRIKWTTLHKTQGGMPKRSGH